MLARFGRVVCWTLNAVAGCLLLLAALTLYNWLGERSAHGQNARVQIVSILQRYEGCGDLSPAAHAQLQSLRAEIGRTIPRATKYDEESFLAMYNNGNLPVDGDPFAPVPKSMVRSQAMVDMGCQKFASVKIAPLPIPEYKGDRWQGAIILAFFAAVVFGAGRATRYILANE